VGDISALEAAQDVNDRINFTDVGEELVAEAFALGCSADESGNVYEFDLGFDLLGGLRDGPDAIEANLSRRGSGTATSPTFGSMVQNG